MAIYVIFFNANLNIGHCRIKEGAWLNVQRPVDILKLRYIRRNAQKNRAHNKKYEEVAQKNKEYNSAGGIRWQLYLTRRIKCSSL